MQKPQERCLYTETGKLKKLWLSWPVEKRRHWLGVMHGTTKNATIITMLLAETGCKLSHPPNLIAFRNWADEQEIRDREEEQQRIDREAILGRLPGLSADQLREEIIRLSIERAVRVGNWEMGLRAAGISQKERQLTLERDKFEAMERRAKQADATEDTLRQPMSDVERAQRIKEIYGLK
jgi:hypothetical protein